MLLKRIRQFGYLNVYGGMMVYNNMRLILLKRIVPSYRLVDVKMRIDFNNILVILLKSMVRSYRLVDLKWRMDFNNMRVILLKRMCHLKLSN